MVKFLNSEQPKITVMVRQNNPEAVIEEIQKSISEGAEAFCFLTESLLPEYKTKEHIKRVIDSMQGRDAYVTNYIRDNSQPELTDSELAKQLADMIDCGAKLIDVRGDMFCRTENEITRDFFAVQKQKEFISELHKSGAEVIMSTHIFEYKSPETVLEIAKMQQERGADIAKIVTVANSEKELSDAFETLILLKKSIDIPFLFLCNGSLCVKHRLMGPLMGNCMYLCVENSKTEAPQPTIEEAKTLIDKINNRRLTK